MLMQENREIKKRLGNVKKDYQKHLSNLTAGKFPNITGGGAIRDIKLVVVVQCYPFPPRSRSRLHSVQLTCYLSVSPRVMELQARLAR
jgi:hypothetical protein